MKKRNKQLNIIKYIVIGLIIFFGAIVLAVIARAMLVWDGKFTYFSNDQAGLVTSIIEGAVGAIAAGFVLYELKIGDAVGKRQSDIEEAQFLLQYNQVFIQDPNMYAVEQNLEKWMNSTQKSEDLIQDENRQHYINYLVYLEGLAPLIFKGVLHFETIDDLMAYRFFLAINNPVLQKDQLFAYPDYYKGCFKLYKEWKRYRNEKGYPILQGESSLDLWDKFAVYAMRDISVARLSADDNLKEVASLIYDTDPYIYPAAFHTKKKARKVIANMISLNEGLFRRENIFVAKKGKTIVGITVFAENAAQATRLPKLCASAAFDDVNEKYFAEIQSMISTGDLAYIACVCVREKYRGEHIGELMIKVALEYLHAKEVCLDVIQDNAAAVHLYKKYGFTEVEVKDGYAYQVPAPQVLTMRFSNSTD